jgi:hypothetical protein
MKKPLTLFLLLCGLTAVAVPPYTPTPPPLKGIPDPTPEAAHAQKLPPYTHIDVNRNAISNPSEIPHINPEVPYSPYPVTPFDTTQGRTTDPVVAAQDEAAHWLGLLDQGQYGPSWLDSGSLMKDILSEQQWMGAMQANRKPYGNVLSRRPGPNASTTTLAHGTKGNFMVIRYDTLFSRNIRATETLILMQNQLGQWRVVSYTID